MNPGLQIEGSLRAARVSLYGRVLASFWLALGENTVTVLEPAARGQCLDLEVYEGRATVRADPTWHDILDLSLSDYPDFGLLVNGQLYRLPERMQSL